MRIAVVGRGLIGSAAAKYLAQDGHRVLLIGPDEPAEKTLHRGVFASHYDEGRITRALDADPFWSAVSVASIARYRAIETESGVPFFTEAGAVLAGPATGPMMQGVSAVQANEGIAAERLEDAQLARRFPMFRFADDVVAFHESSGAGHISARSLVRAQGRLAEMAGAKVLRSVAQGITAERGGVTVATDEGPVKSDKVLVAAGGFTNSLLANALALKVLARTVAFFRIEAEERARLGRMPSLVWEDRNGRDSYLLPPIRYPDGVSYLKIGGDPEDRVLSGSEEIADWFRSGGAREVGQALKEQLEAGMPSLRSSAMRTEACVTTYAEADRPKIGMLEDRIGVAVAGCGRGAKCSDELGRIAAKLFGPVQ